MPRRRPPGRPSPGHPALALAFAAALSLPFAGAATARTACMVPQNLLAFRADLIAGINHERAARGVAPLAVDARLEDAAQGQACDDAVKHIYSHVGLDGSDSRDAAQAPELSAGRGAGEHRHGQ